MAGWSAKPRALRRWRAVTSCYTQERSGLRFPLSFCHCMFCTVLRIRDVYPGSWFLTIPDSGSKNINKREGWKKICYHTIFYSHKFHKIENYFIFEMLKKLIWANFQRIIELFTQKIVNKLSKYGFGIRDPGKTYPGSRGQKGTGFRIRIRNTGSAECTQYIYFW